MFAWLKRMDDERPAILLDEKEAQWRWTHGYVENVADGIVLAGTGGQARGSIYNVGVPITMTMAETIRKIGEEAGWQGNNVGAPQGKEPQPIGWGVDAGQ